MTNIRNCHVCGGSLRVALSLFRSLDVPRLRGLSKLDQSQASLVVPTGIMFGALFSRIGTPIFLFDGGKLHRNVIVRFLGSGCRGGTFDICGVTTRSIDELTTDCRALTRITRREIGLISVLCRRLYQLNVFSGGPRVRGLLRFKDCLCCLNRFIRANTDSRRAFCVVSGDSLSNVDRGRQMDVTLLTDFGGHSLFGRCLAKFAS